AKMPGGRELSVQGALRTMPTDVGLSEIGRRACRQLLPESIYCRAARLYAMHVGVRELGLREYQRLQRAARAPGYGRPEVFRLSRFSYPVEVRPGTTDGLVLESNLLRCCYG